VFAKYAKLNLYDYIKKNIIINTKI